jgi:hypothetical protein
VTKEGGAGGLAAVVVGLDCEEGLPARLGKGAIPIVNSKKLLTQARVMGPENRKLGKDWTENFIKNNYSNIGLC